MPSILITGGAGYIGSVSALSFQEAGWEVSILDDLSRGHRGAIPAGARFHKGDICDRQDVLTALQAANADCVLHCAALAYVGESFERPSDYFRTNIGGTANLLGAMVEAGIERVVFSSSCTVYGEPLRLPIDEDEPVKPPVSPYGQSKQACEQMLHWLSQTGALTSASLRYFNAAGAWGDYGEDHRPETHLIPIVIDAAMGSRGPLQIFGNDYPTPDGTCIRDYIHIRDLAEAHLLAASHLLTSPRGTHFQSNLGTGRGHSILKIIEAVTRITGKPVPHTIGPRRSGDAPELVAANGKARRELGWNPKHSDLDTIITHAWQWRLAHPNGYPPK